MGVAVIVGGNRGIGLGWVEEYLKAGYSVVTTYRNEAKLDALQYISANLQVSLKTLQEMYPEKLSLYQLDVTDKDGVEKFAKTIQKIDVLIISAGIKGYSIASTEPRDHFALHSAYDHTSQHLADSLRVNTQAPDDIIRSFYPLLSKSKNACVAYMSSLVGQTADNSSGGYHPYRIAKAASNMLVSNYNRQLMRDWQQSGGLVSEGPCAIALCPGWVRTDMGGPTASLSITDSVSAMKQVVDSVIRTKKSNALYMYDGTVAEQYPV